MLDNILAALSEMLTVGFVEDKYLAILMFLILALIMNIGYQLAKKMMKELPLTIILLFIVVIITGWYINENNEFRILEFKTNKPVYNADDKTISFRIKSNRNAYYYLYTENAETKTMIPLQVRDDNRLIAYKSDYTNDFKIKTYVGDEKVILVLTTKPYLAFRQEMTKKRFTKQLEASGTNSGRMNDTGEVSPPRVLIVKIKKDETLQQTDTGVLVRMTINTESSEYGLGEDISFSIETSKEGYVTVFEASPVQNIVRKKSAYTQNRVLRSFTTATLPIGEHIAIAIYTEKNEHIDADDFTIDQIDKKGGIEYAVHFKNGKNYVTNYVTYNIYE